MAVKKTTKRLSAKAEAEKRSAAAKKAAATRAANKAARAATLIKGEFSYNTDEVADDNVFYVVMERGFLKASAHGLYATRAAATAAASSLEDTSSAAFNKYTVQRVELVQ